MKKIIFIMVLFSIIIAGNLDNQYKITRAEWLKTDICNYVNGFNKFDTTVIVGDIISIGIYYNKSSQNIKKANQLKNRFKTQVQHILNKHSWASNLKLIVTVYGEN
ncbi:hypothetical protein OAR19_00140 [bacterium]|nr:hypothetical protein [bacterium]